MASPRRLQYCIPIEIHHQSGCPFFILPNDKVRLRSRAKRPRQPFLPASYSRLLSPRNPVANPYSLTDIAAETDGGTRILMTVRFLWRNTLVESFKPCVRLSTTISTGVANPAPGAANLTVKCQTS